MWEIEKGKSNLVFEVVRKDSYATLSRMVDESHLPGIVIAVHDSRYLRKILKNDEVETVVVYPDKSQVIDPRVLRDKTVMLIQEFLANNDEGIMLVDVLEELGKRLSADEMVKTVQNLVSFKSCKHTILATLNPVVLPKDMVKSLTPHFDAVQDVRAASIGGDNVDCPNCGAQWDSLATVCSMCGYNFKSHTFRIVTSSEAAPPESDEPVDEEIDIGGDKASTNVDGQDVRQQPAPETKTKKKGKSKKKEPEPDIGGGKASANVSELDVRQQPKKKSSKKDKPQKEAPLPEPEFEGPVEKDIDIFASIVEATEEKKDAPKEKKEEPDRENFLENLTFKFLSTEKEPDESEDRGGAPAPHVHTPPMAKRDEGGVDWFSRGVSMELKGDSIGALDAYDRALGTSPNDPWIWLNKGVSLQRLGRLEDALKCYDESIRLDPSDPDTWSNRATALRGIGRLEESVESYKRALELNPEDGGIWSNLGIALRSMGHLDEALQAYESALSLTPRDISIWLNKAAVLSSLNKFQEAMECYDRVLSMDPQNNGVRELKKFLERKAARQSAY